MTVASEPSKPKRISWKTQAVLSLVALGLLALAVRSNRKELAEVFAKKPDFALLGLGFCIYMTGLCLTFLRWYLLARAVDFPFKLRDAFRLGFIGNVFNLVIPGAVGGDLIKVVFLCQEKPESRTQAVASVVLDRLVGLLGLFLLGGLLGLSAWNSEQYELRIMLGFVWLAALGVVCVLVTASTPALYRPLERALKNRPKIAGAITRLAEVAAVYRTKVKVVGIAIFMSMCVHGLSVVVFYLVGKSLFGTIPSLASHFVIVPLALFSTAVPLPLGNLGLTEHITDTLFNFVDHPSGAVAMMGFRIEMYAVGLVSLLIYLVNARQVRELSRKGEQMDTPAAAVEAGSVDHTEPIKAP